MRKVGSQEFQELSEVPLFNLIGCYADQKGYDVVYFKTLMPKGRDDNFEYKYMHYIHLYKDEEMKISIYFDKHNLGCMFPEYPYYELYDRCDTERFLNTDEEAMNLFNRVKELMIAKEEF